MVYMGLLNSSFCRAGLVVFPLLTLLDWLHLPLSSDSILCNLCLLAGLSRSNPFPKHTSSQPKSIKMGLGVLEDRQMAAPPGTSTLGASAATGM
jgi:hypothetical protein